MTTKLFEEKKYTDSIFYYTSLTGKYIKKMGEQLFRKLDIDFTVEEFSALDFLYEAEDICQRDLAVKMLIDRANMGKILNSLEKKGFIIRKLSLRNNRPVKVINLTKLGEETYVKVLGELKNVAKDAVMKISEDEVISITSGLEKIRNVLKNILTIDI